MRTARQTAPYTRPNHIVLLVSESRHRTIMLSGRLEDAGCGYERLDRAFNLTTRARYTHYDAIVVDLDQSRSDVIDSVKEFRQLEESRGQPRTPIIGISSSDDALADLDAIDCGCTDVLRCAANDQSISRAITRAIQGTFQSA